MEQPPTTGTTQALDPNRPLASLRPFPPVGVGQVTGRRFPFPGDDNHHSLAQMAKSDLEAALQLLVDRAQYITGASGAAIALRDREQMICRASAGASAPKIGARLQLDSGLTGESVRQKKLMRCDDVETDLRVNRESCRTLGIVSVVVLPLIREEKVFGIFELLSSKAYAFEERDIIAVERLGEMIQTALDVEPDTGMTLPLEQEALETEEVSETKKQAGQSAPAENKIAPSQALPTRALGAEESFEPVVPVDPAAVARLHARVNKCNSCGFPVSGGRKYCIDCESSNAGKETSSANANEPGFLANYADQQKNWLSRNIYWIGIVLMSLGTAAFLLLRSK